MDAQNEKSFIKYSSVAAVGVDWLWYPYIPFGKITVLQGDPGEGKSTVMMNIIGSVTRGRTLPGGSINSPINVIYQCSEDGAADTIKPRLIAADADCDKVAFIDEGRFFSSMTLDDEQFRNAVSDFGARLLVIDPFQAYLGDADISNATSIRRIIRRLSLWAQSYNCAVVLVGHLNKNQGSRELYRGLGSIDVIAAARSVLQIEKTEDESSSRILRQIKNSLSAKAADRYFEIDQEGRVIWMESDDLCDAQSPGEIRPEEKNKQEIAADMIRAALLHGPVKASEVTDTISANGIGFKTIQNVKRMLGIISVKKTDAWYWMLPQGESIDNG